MQLASHPSAFLERRQVLGTSVQLRVGDSYPGVCRKRLYCALIGGAEATGLAAGQEDVAEHLAAMPDRHPQEILQHRVAVGVVAEPRVAPDVRQPDRTLA